MQAPAISIVLPAYNRRNVIMRAVASVRAQTFQEWELIVVDDGSTDGTTEGLESLDSRIRVLHQQNSGAAAARNRGIAACQGEFIAFLDSDDEWLPHFLTLTHTHLQCHPQDAFVATEFLEVNAHGSHIQDRSVIRDLYVPLAARIGSIALDLPAGCNDDYLRVYSSCEPLEESCRAKCPGIDVSTAKCYRGLIGEAYRWGHFHALWCLLLRRETVLAIGPMAEDRRSCADFKFLVELCRRFPAAMISIPSVVKHELDSTQRKQAEGHLSAGAGYAQFMKNQTALFEELFVSRYSQDRDVQSIYALMCLKAAGVLLDYGERSAALNCMRKARKFAPSSKWWTVYWTLAALSPTTRIGSFLTRHARKIEDSRLRPGVASAQPSI